MFGRKIKHMLAVRDMTQADLIRSTGLHKNLIMGLVNDRLTNTTTDTIIKISKALRISPAYFFTEHAYTPIEVLDDLPEHIKDFILDLDNMDYLELAQDISEKKIPTEYIDKIVSAYEDIIKK